MELLVTKISTSTTSTPKSEMPSGIEQNLLAFMNKDET